MAVWSGCLLQNWQTIRPEWNQLSLDNGLNRKKRIRIGGSQASPLDKTQQLQSIPPAAPAECTIGHILHHGWCGLWDVIRSQAAHYLFSYQRHPEPEPECWAAELATWGEGGRPEIIWAKVTSRCPDLFYPVVIVTWEILLNKECVKLKKLMEFSPLLFLQVSSFIWLDFS